jgi:hypothetical protein
MAEVFDNPRLLPLWGGIPALAFLPALAVALPKSDYGCFAAHLTSQSRPWRRSGSAGREMIIG